jgi:hypothetical protein
MHEEAPRIAGRGPPRTRRLFGRGGDKVTVWDDLKGLSFAIFGSASIAGSAGAFVQWYVHREDVAEDRDFSFMERQAQSELENAERWQARAIDCEARGRLLSEENVRLILQASKGTPPEKVLRAVTEADFGHSIVVRRMPSGTLSVIGVSRGIAYDLLGSPPHLYRGESLEAVFGSKGAKAFAASTEAAFVSGGLEVQDEVSSTRTGLAGYLTGRKYRVNLEGHEASFIIAQLSFRARNPE